MDKNVGSVNLDELKAARESLDRERGVETDPNLYKDYDPEKHKAEKEQEELARKNQLDEVASDVSDDEIQISNDSSSSTDAVVENDVKAPDEDSSVQATESTSNSIEEDFKQFEVSSDEPSLTASLNDEQINLNDGDSSSSEQKKDETAESTSKNFDAYDSFADFEVNSGEVSVQKEPEIVNPKTEEEEISVDETISEDDDDVIDTSIDDFLSELDSILAENPTSTTENNTSAEELSEKTEETVESVEIQSQEESSQEDLKKPVDALDRFKVDDSEIIQDESVETNTEILTDLSKIGEIANDIEIEKQQAQESAKIEENNSSVDEEVVVENDSTEDESESTDDSQEDEIVAGAYKKIESFKFVDVISADEFRDVDNFSYVLGKDDEGEIVYSNLRDTCGTMIYTRNEDVVFNSFSSILLSLLLKNTPHDVQFMICDAMFDSEFDVFNDSSYMYLNRVAKNNREIVDSLLELSKELEKRYNNLVYAGVKTISAYNLQAEERGMEKMPYLVLFLNNYAKMVQFLDADRINVCLHNILKFGRLVGIYAIVATASEIERNEINFNLPTRICFGVESVDESISALGRQGAEELKDEQDFLYSTVYDEELRHLKVADISRAEIELIIENLEK